MGLWIQPWATSVAVSCEMMGGAHFLLATKEPVQSLSCCWYLELLRVAVNVQYKISWVLVVTWALGHEPCWQDWICNWSGWQP
jgi:hypothetical protein